MVRTYGVSRKNPTGISDILTRMKNPQTRKSKQQSLKKEDRDPCATLLILWDKFEAPYSVLTMMSQQVKL